LEGGRKQEGRQAKAKEKGDEMKNNVKETRQEGGHETKKKGDNKKKKAEMTALGAYPSRTNLHLPWPISSDRDAS